YLLHKKLKAVSIVHFINDVLGERVKLFGYNYSDIILARIYTAFCGGDATEDVNYVRENTLNQLTGISIASADTILRGDIELSVPCDFIKTDSGKENKININPKMNKFLIRSSIKFKQLNPNDTELIYDFDHQFIPAEKYDATYSYKNKKGYFPAVATISNIPVYIEGRNGNCNVKTAQLATHKRTLTALAEEGIKPKYARMDCGSYIKEVTDHFHNEGILFFIRANNSETLVTRAADQENWQHCTINFQDMEVTSFPYQFGKHEHRIIAYRTPNKTGQIGAFSRDAKKYMFIITNRWEVSEIEAIEFYNKRGDSERVFDIQNNDFNWNSMPHSFLEENTVYLIIMAVAHIIYKWLLSIFCQTVKGLTKTSRLKKFIFKFVNTVAKFTQSGRQQIVHLATKNQALIKLANAT
ncbi:IS1380 family transposase, partial [bacterium]|nr:IS1380 family transposase [bacterium]